MINLSKETKLIINEHHGQIMQLTVLIFTTTSSFITQLLDT